jgi:hypothetical protein
MDIDLTTGDAITIVVSATSLLVPLNFLLFNNFLDKLYYNADSRRWRDKNTRRIFDLYFVFVDHLNSELALNAVFFCTYLLFYNSRTISAFPIVIGYLILKVLILVVTQRVISGFRRVRAYHWDLKELRKHFDYVWTRPLYFFKLVVSILMALSVFLSPVLLLPAPSFVTTSFLDVFVTGHPQVICVAAIILHIFVWMLQILIWMPGATMLGAMKKYLRVS